MTDKKQTEPMLPADYAIAKYLEGDARAKVFYKYQVWRSYSYDTLKSNHIYMSEYRELNDPFDPWISSLATGHPGFPTIQHENEDFVSSLRHVAVFSVSELNNSELLWAHYANRFRGFCIGYVAYMVPHPQILLPVRYYETIPSQLLAPEIADELWLIEWFITKSTAWSYEAEWRFLVSGEGGLWPSPFGLMEVIFGTEMAPQEQLSLLDATRQHNPTYFVASPSIEKNRFTVQVERIGNAKKAEQHLTRLQNGPRGHAPF
jgi:hypothetical protein